MRRCKNLVEALPKSEKNHLRKMRSTEKTYHKKIIRAPCLKGARMIFFSEDEPLSQRMPAIKQVPSRRSCSLAQESISKVGTASVITPQSQRSAMRSSSHASGEAVRT